MVNEVLWDGGDKERNIVARFSFSMDYKQVGQLCLARELKAGQQKLTFRGQQLGTCLTYVTVMYSSLV